MGKVRVKMNGNPGTFEVANGVATISTKKLFSRHETKFLVDQVQAVSVSKKPLGNDTVTVFLPAGPIEVEAGKGSDVEKALGQ